MCIRDRHRCRREPVLTQIRLDERAELLLCVQDLDRERIVTQETAADAGAVPQHDAVGAILWLHVGRRVGLWLEGINFPGHFLVRCKGMLGETAPSEDLILDPFHGGIVLTERDCARLLSRHAGDDARFDRLLLAPAFKAQILVRMLVNLKRAYARLRSFAQAHAVSDVVLALDPTSITEIRDRGLLSYQMGHFNAALADLEHYLSLTARHSKRDDEEADVKEEFEAVWEHVKDLRRRVASLN